MDREKFINKRPYLYHLTSYSNAINIAKERRIISTTEMVMKSNLGDKEKKDFLTQKRPDHSKIIVDGKNVDIRDQAPISIKVLSKSLTNDWTPGEFIKFLNDRVFFWPNLNRLQRHYNRYKLEDPTIFRVSTSDLFALNPEIRLCRLNSGATRCSHHHYGAAPPRGIDTFQLIENYNLSVSSVAEVTIVGECIIPEELEIGKKPNGPWENVK